ncbi:MAG: pilus assembly protein [Propionibacteriaceae bacterium]|nr:pilus assembly protein [Propionibacteriaceae bacterium]
MNQRGVSESTQWALLTPLVLLLTLGLVQLGVWLHARTVAGEAAATVADLLAAGSPGALAAGERIAVASGLRDVAITTAWADGLVVVTVSGRVPIFFDVGQGQIAERAVLPAEEAR